MSNPENKKPNRLVHEKSLYLLQHAYNPVNWYPWSEEAFEQARREAKPIFLSIGYSTCHWCHVMEKESFEDEEVAAALNRVFVCIKVDREERPDIDHLYMTVCQAMTGSGGWPLTILISPDKRPFFAGTYFPKTSLHGRVGVFELTERVEELWQTSQKELTEAADSVLKTLQSISRVSPGVLPGEEVLHKGFQQLATCFDPKHGGFGNAPKFPTPHNLLFLLRYWKRTKNIAALQMVEKSLLTMSNGGIYDHLGFGFHRYSTDSPWLLPHFEKMLYDQALLIIAYLETFQATGKTVYANIAKEVIDYVLRDMTSPEGGFYSAEDADSEGEEGKFYLWSHTELSQILGEIDMALFVAAYNIRKDGNFNHEATRIPSGLNIPHRTKTSIELAQELNISSDSLEEKLATLRQKLFDIREKRVHPAKDDKILTDWNGLMIAALALAGRLLGDLHYTESAKKSADFVLSHLRRNGRLLKRYRQGDTSLPAHLDDYTFFVWGLLELYESTFDPAYLREALRLNQLTIDLFWDNEGGGFYFTATDAEDLRVRHRELYDGALPSGNSVATINNLRLERLTGNSRLVEIAQKIARSFSRNIQEEPHAYTHMLCSIDFMLGPTTEVVIAGELRNSDTQLLLNNLNAVFLPNKVVLLHPSGEAGKDIEELAPFIREQQPVEGKATAYICRNFSCLTPVTDGTALLKLLK
ncbi:MAG: hypothetical protein DDT40_00317 [candidate division WS2 bacterium]|nr:hypothetical protein [Candidatus Psychracetigena formicireducens]